MCFLGATLGSVLLTLSAWSTCRCIFLKIFFSSFGVFNVESSPERVLAGSEIPGGEAIGEPLIPNVTLSPQNDSYIKMGKGVTHCNVSFIVD